MYIRVSNGSFDPSRYDELVSLTEDIAARLTSLPGFVSYYGGSDRQTGALVAITVWETEETANCTWRHIPADERNQRAA